MFALFDHIRAQARALFLITLIAAPLAASAAPTVRFAGEATSVTLSTDFVGALGALQVTPAPLGLAFLADGVAVFPISSGALDLADAQGQIVHLGGLKLTAGSTVVELSDFIIDTTQPANPQLTGIVVANGSLVGRLPLFDLQLPSLSLPLQPGGNFGRLLDLPGVGVTLDPQAAAALNSVFHVSAFSGGLKIGTAEVRAFIRRNRSPAFQFRPD